MQRRICTVDISTYTVLGTTEGIGICKFDCFTNTKKYLILSSKIIYNQLALSNVYQTRLDKSILQGRGDSDSSINDMDSDDHIEHHFGRVELDPTRDGHHSQKWHRFLHHTYSLHLVLHHNVSVLPV